MPARKRVVFTSGGTPYDLGNYNDWVSFDYRGNNSSRVIPRAKGVSIQGSSDLGGGELTITVECFSADFASRLAAETAINTLIANIANKKGDLSIDSTLSLTDCYIDSFSTDRDNQKYIYFTITFLKSL